jgi:dTDP-4-dehydrorhamnose reductase
MFGVYLKNNNKILLIGGTGNLGSSIIKSKIFKNIDSPLKKELNLLNKLSIRKYLNKKYNLIINCAALARMKECENNPLKAVKINVFGTLNLVNEVIAYKKKSKKEVKVIHISTDGVYPSTKGRYSENSSLKPYNIYGWTKLGSELIIKNLDKYIVVRTRFFDKKNIKYSTAATDIFTSMIEIQNLVKEIKKISFINFNGELNIGEKRNSDFNIYKKFKPKIKPCKHKDIIRNLNFKIAKDASMNTNLLKKIKNK